MIKLIVAGDRHFLDYKFVEKHLCDLLVGPNATREVVEIIQGGATGVDALAKRFAMDYFFRWRTFPADWNQFGKAAGPMRNRKMAEYGDCLLALWDGKTRGTGNMIEEMKALAKPYRIITI